MESSRADTAHAKSKTNPSAVVKPFVRSPVIPRVKILWHANGRANVKQSLYIEFVAASLFGLVLPFLDRQNTIRVDHFDVESSMLDVGRLVLRSLKWGLCDSVLTKIPISRSVKSASVYGRFLPVGGEISPKAKRSG